MKIVIEICLYINELVFRKLGDFIWVGFLVFLKRLKYFRSIGFVYL